MIFFKTNSTIGLDISDLSLKACRLSKRRGGIYLDSFKTAPVPDNYIEKGRILEKEKVAELIKRVLKEVQGGRLKKTLINTVLPETSTFVKLIKDLKTDSDGKSLEERIKAEIACHIPYDIKDIYLDWQEIEEDAAASKKFFLVGVCPRDIVKEYIEVLHSIGCVPNCLEIEALPIVRSIFDLNKKDVRNLASRNIIVFDLGAARSSMIFWREQGYANMDILEFTVSLPLSGREINKTIEQKYKLNSAQAEQFKIQYGLTWKHGILQTLIEPLLKQFYAKISQAIDFHKSYLEGATLNKILLCGGGANLKGLQAMISKEFKLPVEMADPLINIKNKKAMPRADAMSYATAIGLALRDFYL